MSYKFRCGADSGQWLSLLLPLCSLPFSAESYKSAADVFIFIVIAWLPVSYFIQSIYFHKNAIDYMHHVIFSIPVSVFLSWFTSQNVIVTYLVCFAAVLTYNRVFSELLLKCPGSFTMGEVQTITQGIIIFILNCFISLKQQYQYSSVTRYTEAMDLLKILLVGLLLLLCCLYAVPSLGKGLKMYFICLIFAMPMIVIWSYHHRKNLILWCLEFCFYNAKRMYLIFFWLFLTISSIGFVVWINQKQHYRASTLDRKFFHIVISAIYISGSIFDVQFLCFASGMVLGAFIVLEVYRVLKVPFIGPIIKEAFQIFLDEKDSGILILTHIYLLIGCSCPIWLSSYYVNNNKYHISLLSGVISVGFGDTFAAIGGTLFGKYHWKRSKKTLEGTVCAIIIQLVCSFFFLYIGHSFHTYNIALVVTSVILTSLLEAKTTQIDNLVLPLFMFIFLSWIK